ncbi:MAG TPA: hypothetical protein VFV38_39765 [Ktedonobacteraceae bacterium]|nr:hypothetical protein [Ktedonobacteraceae bacterium]
MSDTFLMASAADDDESCTTSHVYNLDRVKEMALPLPIDWYWMESYRIV